MAQVMKVGGIWMLPLARGGILTPKDYSTKANGKKTKRMVRASLNGLMVEYMSVVLTTTCSAAKAN